jgi:S1-C subfamily serine protease
MPARVIASDEGADLAVLKIESEELGGSRPLLLSAERSETLGESIVALGFPLAGTLGQDVKVTNGIVSGQSGPSNDRRFMQISIPVQPGNSGGPVLDSFGRVVGVVAARLASKFGAENVNFAVRISALRSFLELNGIAYGSPAASRQIPITEVTRLSAPSVLLVGCYR